MYSSGQEPIRRRKKPRGYEIASYILMAGGAINLVTGLALLLFTAGLFRRISPLPFTPFRWYTLVLLGQIVTGLTIMFVGVGLYLYAKE